ncbi:non-ribosomal peptide synthetase, partial [Microbulbifer epialgicus]
MEKLLRNLAEVGVELALKDDKLVSRSSKGKLTSELANRIRDNREKIIQYLKNKDKNLERPPLFPRCNRKIQDQVLSFSQERLWFVCELDPNNGHYNMPGVLSLSGALCINSFESAVREIITRHEILRTVYCEMEIGVRQVVLDTYRLPIQRTNLTNLSKDQKSLRIAELSRLDSMKPFDIKRELPVRFNLCLLSDVSSVLIINVHHIACDGWSIGILIDEFNHIYESYKGGLDSKLAPLGLQYADYAIWQRDWLKGDVLDQELLYWKSKLSNMPSVHSFPLDKIRPASQRFIGKSTSTVINKQVLSKIKSMSENYGVTIAMFFQSVFSVIIGRYSDETDIVLGAATAGRLHHDIEPLIGFFVNDIILRFDLSGNPTFEELLYRNREMILEAYSHQNAPFEQVVEAINPVRSQSYNPGFQIKIDVLISEGKQLSAKDVKFDSYDLPSEREIAIKYDLHLSVVEKGGEAVLSWQYSTDLFFDETIHRLSNNFIKILDSIVSSPNKNLLSLDFIAEKEITFLKQSGLGDQFDLNFDCDVCDLFEEQVDKFPNSTALLFNNNILSYSQLNERSNRVARYLVMQGVKAETLVGVCVDRSFELVISVLGIMKAGGVYFPIDPNFPEVRIKELLKDSCCHFVLTQSDFLSEIPFENVKAIPIDGQFFDLSFSEYSVENLSKDLVGRKSGQLAYIIYTSGSTGEPKGVMLEHKSLANVIIDLINRYEVTSDSVILQFISCVFDVSISEIFLSLCTGASLQLANSEQLLPGREFSDFINHNKITHIHLSPTVLSLLNPGSEMSIKAVIVGGDYSVTSLMKLWSRYCNYYIAYGPTESTICTSTSLYSNELQHKTIGRPISNVYYVVFDNHLKMVPLGATGELYIGGVGVARGYLNRPELTKEKFISNPFSSDPNDRLYKTGDLVRWLPDGNLEFMGRIDDQVKLRGFRIELG